MQPWRVDTWLGGLGGFDGRREGGGKLFVGKWISYTTKSSSCLLLIDGRLNVGPGFLSSGVVSSGLVVEQLFPRLTYFPNADQHHFGCTDHNTLFQGLNNSLRRTLVEVQCEHVPQVGHHVDIHDPDDFWCMGPLGCGKMFYRGGNYAYFAFQTLKAICCMLPQKMN